MLWVDADFHGSPLGSLDLCARKSMMTDETAEAGGTFSCIGDR